MSVNVGVERCFAFINCQLQAGREPESPGAAAARWFITLSRQSASGAHATGETLAKILQSRMPPGPAPWTVFDRNLVERVIEDHHLPRRLEKYMPEDRVTEITDIMDELFGLHPSSWTLVHQTSETILRLAQLGCCILIGRAAPAVTGRLEHGFHVRLIGSLEKRIERMMHFEELDRTAARKRIEKEDRARERYVRKYFRVNVNDPLRFDLVVNTDYFTAQDVAEVIAEAFLRRVRNGEPPVRTATRDNPLPR